MESSLVAYADESSVQRSAIHQEYLVCASIIESNERDELREALRPLLLPGQIKLHWTDESDRRRREIVRTLSSLDSFQVLITNRSERSRKTERFRRKCLEKLYFELSTMQITDLTLEGRQESQNRRDLEHIVALQASGQFRGLRIAHAKGGDEPLLWIPDVMLGAFNAAQQGRYEFWNELQEKVIHQSQAEGSL